jgi:glycosidase
MLEVHVGTLTGTGLAPFPTYEPLLEELPRIKERGFDAVYLMPHVPYPSYSVIDYMDMDIQQGSDAGFRAFVSRSHELGMKVFIDVTMHGVMDRRARRTLAECEGWYGERYPVEPSMPEVHPYLTDHPEWFSRTERGEIAMTYTYAFDHASPSWQDFMVSVFRHYVEEYDIDGFRVDSHTWNFFPNWARGLPYPASASFYGSARLFEKVRRELKRIKPDVVLYSETAGPLFCKTHELMYNYDETWMLLSTIPVVSRKGLLCHFAHPSQVTTERMNARHIATWMAQRQLVTPPGAIRVHHLDCHDTYWVSKEFRSRTFGIPASRAIVALFAFTEGGFMDYFGADKGSEEFYRRVLSLRRSQPVLKNGTCDYLAAKPDNDMVLAPLREWQERVLLPVINFDNADCTVTISLPADKFADGVTYEVRDLMNDEPLAQGEPGGWRAPERANVQVSLPPYGVRLLSFAPAG